MYDIRAHRGLTGEPIFLSPVRPLSVSGSLRCVPIFQTPLRM